ncbi:hypothetical protein JTB14_012483 [Gonioctena quinquepunctata]|nr:hypothetical protein JTB14_012483 [Gonioctena quinquepunctata]
MSLDSILNLIKKVCVTNYLKTLAFTFLLTKFPSCSVKRIFWGLVNKLSANDIEGAAHADDLLYLFKTGLSPNILKGSKEDGYIQKFVKPWTNFAKYGNPTPEEDGVLDNVLWRPIVSENMENIFDINETITVTGNLERERMEFWDDLYRTHANI